MAGCSKGMSVFTRSAPKRRDASLPRSAAGGETRRMPGEKRVPSFRARSDRSVGRVKSIRLAQAGENNGFFNSLQGWKG